MPRTLLLLVLKSSIDLAMGAVIVVAIGCCMALVPSTLIVAMFGIGYSGGMRFLIAMMPFALAFVFAAILINSANYRRMFFLGTVLGLATIIFTAKTLAP